MTHVRRVHTDIMVTVLYETTVLKKTIILETRLVEKTQFINKKSLRWSFETPGRPRPQFTPCERIAYLDVTVVAV